MIDPVNLVPLPVLLPLLGAGAAVVAYRHPLLQRVVSTLALGLGLIVAFALVWVVDSGPMLVMNAGGWPSEQGIVLVVDRLSAIMLAVSYVVTFAVLLYSMGQARASEDDQDDGKAPLPIFHPTLLVLMAGVATTFVSGDLFHIYVGFEMLLFASFVLLTLGGSEPRIRAGVNYVMVNLLSSVVFLAAIALIYAATGTVNLAQLSVRLGDLEPGVQLTLHLLLLLGFAIKAAIFPMSAWLPDSYPTAPASVTAVFAGLLTKVGVYAIIRTQTLLFPDGRLDGLLMWAALATMLVGILGAVAQDDIKRLLSFTLVSHIGYMVFGVALGTVTGLSAAIYYVAHHITIQTTLFLVIGLIERRTGTTSMSKLGGLASTAPLIALMFFVPAMNLAGIPPLSGFLGKVGLMQAAADVATPTAYVLIGGSALTSLLTLYAISRIWGRAFWRKPRNALVAAGGEAAPQASAGAPVEQAQEALPGRRLGWAVLVPSVGLILVSLGFTVFAGPIYAMTDRGAANLLDRDVYIGAVDKDGVP